MKKVQWNKMHTKDYQGNCVCCGGKCENTESIKNWELAYDNLVQEQIFNSIDNTKKNYYAKRIQEKQNFTTNY